MISSMTGFSRIKVESDNYSLDIDIKTVNSKYFDLNIKGPRILMPFEDRIKENIRKYIKRGSISIYLNLELIGDVLPSQKIDYNLLNAYIENLSKISSLLKSSSPFSAIDLLSLDEDLLKTDQPDLSRDNELINLIDEATSLALQSLLEMRQDEGYNIKIDLEQKLLEMDKVIDEINSLSIDHLNVSVKALEDRVTSTLNNFDLELDRDRLYNEIVFYTDRLIIDEELIRLKSHIDLMKKNLASSDDLIGKKLDFISQEMNREANTIGSKTSSLEIKKLVIELKTIIENIREQIQNIQ